MNDEPSGTPVTTPSTPQSTSTSVSTSAATASPGRLGSLGPVGLVLAGGISVQFGAAIAVTLMPRAGALGVVALRLFAAAVVLLVVCRPRLRGHSRTDWGTVVVFGITMGAMNGLFYEAVDRIPLGTAVTLEVLGPLALSVLASRRLINVLWAGLALGGVFLLGGGGFGGLDPIGVVLALAAGAMWATYIIFSARTGRRFPQADGLALAMAVAALLFLPLGIADAGTRLLDPTTLALGSSVAILSSVLPYTLELLALRRLPAHTFAVLMSLEPAIAATAGFLILDQALTATEAAAIALVIAASIGAVRSQVGRGGNRPAGGPQAEPVAVPGAQPEQVVGAQQEQEQEQEQEQVAGVRPEAVASSQPEGNGSAS